MISCTCIFCHILSSIFSSTVLFIYCIFICFSYTLSIIYIFHFRSFTFFFLFISTCTCHYLHIITYNKLIDIFALLSILYLFRSPVGVAELIPIQRYLYTYLYFYLSYICSTELILVLQSLYLYYGAYTYTTELILVLRSLYMYRGTRRYYRTYTYTEVPVGTFKAERCTLLYSYSYSVPYHITVSGTYYMTSIAYYFS